jgi:aspartate aminotransferase
MSTIFDKVPLAPEDAVFGLSAQCSADPHPEKVNLVIGAYRDEDLKPWVLPVVRQVQTQLASDPAQNHEYLAIDGSQEFCHHAARLIMGDEFVLANKDRVTSVQAISGTGALRLAAEFIAKFMPGKACYISNPSWGNHKAIFASSRVEPKEYRYWNPKTLGLDLSGMLEDINAAPEGSVILLHACAHNPTGVDPTMDEWKQIAETIRAKKHFTLFDSAYQGFASGDLDKDAQAVRYFASEGFEFFVAQSFAKNFGLYGERTGALHVLVNDAKTAPAVHSQLNLVIRASFSNPPKYGALIVAAVLKDPKLFDQWRESLRIMSGRIIAMRQALYDALIALNTPGDWKHIITQIGMFSYTGLTAKHVERLIKEFHVYLLSNGRISMCGLSTSKVDYLAKAIHTVVSESNPKL